MRRLTSYYRTKLAPSDYRFEFVELGPGNWRVYILSQPGYGSRSADNHATHRLVDGDRKYICWDGRIPGLADARKVAAEWAERTQEYIRSGRRF